MKWLLVVSVKIQCTIRIHPDVLQASVNDLA